jgi:hypothetical protein
MVNMIIELLKVWISVTIGIASGVIFIVVLATILTLVIAPPKGSED